MAAELLTELDRSLAEHGSAGGLDLLIDHYRAHKEFSLLFEARLMKKRLELGLPLIQTEDPSSLPPELRTAYEQGMVDAAREVGRLYLANRNIGRAWPYFRAIGDTAPVLDAIESFQVADAEADELNAVIAIALQEGVHPAKGLEFILERQGMCRAITTFGMYAVPKDRDRCITLLVRALHAEIVERIGGAIEAHEGAACKASNLVEMMAGRDYLFGEYDYYVDTSHLVSLLPYCVEVTDDETLALYHELCEYGKRLSSQFQSRGQPPFENTYVDYGFYVQALRGIAPDEGIAHFREMLATMDPEQVGFGPAQALVNLLVRLKRYNEALAVSLEYLTEPGSSEGCPTALQLCFLAGDFARLRELACERGDLLSYVAGS